MLTNSNFFMRNLFLLMLLSISLVANVVFYMAWQAAKTQNVKSEVRPVNKSQTRTSLTIPDRAQPTNNLDIKPTQSNYQLLDKLVSDKSYYEAVNLLSSQSSQHTENTMAKWLKHISQLIQSKNFQDAESFLQAVLQEYPDNLQALKLNVDLLKAQLLTIEAINAAYNLPHHVFELRQKTALRQDARTLAITEAMRLTKLRAWPAQKDFARNVLALDSDFAQMQLVLANAQYKLSELNDAHAIAISLIDDTELSTLAERLLDKIELALRSPAQVPLTKRGQHYLVKGLINGEVEIELMLDTGASISLMSEQVFNNLSLDYSAEYLQDIRLGTAGGEITAALYQFSEFELNGFKVENMVFAVSPVELSSDIGLLGMNYLKHFDFYIDQQNQILKLESKQ